MTPIIFFSTAPSRSFLAACLALFLLFQFLGCAQSFKENPPVHSDKQPPLTEDHHTLDSAFKEKIASSLGNGTSFNEGLDPQARAQAQKFEVVRTFAAASGEHCCLILFGNPAEEALFCQKSNGDLVRVRFLNNAHE
jgi:hypothetical protein